MEFAPYCLECEAMLTAEEVGDPVCDTCYQRMLDQVFAEMAAAISAHLRAIVTETGTCMRCCRERATCDGLLCQACYAQALLEETESES